MTEQRDPAWYRWGTAAAATVAHVGRMFSMLILVCGLLGVSLGLGVAGNADSPANATIEYEYVNEHERNITVGENTTTINHSEAGAGEDNESADTQLVDERITDELGGNPLEEFEAAVDERAPSNDRLDSAVQQQILTFVGVLMEWTFEDVGGGTASVAVHSPPWVPLKAIGHVVGMLAVLPMLYVLRRRVA